MLMTGFEPQMSSFRSHCPIELLTCAHQKLISESNVFEGI